MFESRGLDRDRRLSMNQLGAYRVFPEIKKSGLLLPCFKPHTRMVDNQPLPARTNTHISLTQPTTAFLTKILPYSMASRRFWSKRVCKTCSASRSCNPAFPGSDSNAAATSLPWPSPSSLELSFLGQKASPRSTSSLLRRTQSCT